MFPDARKEFANVQIRRHDGRIVDVVDRLLYGTPNNCEIAGVQVPVAHESPCSVAGAVGHLDARTVQVTVERFHRKVRDAIGLLPCTGGQHFGQHRGTINVRAPR